MAYPAGERMMRLRAMLAPLSCVAASITQGASLWIVLLMFAPPLSTRLCLAQEAPRAEREGAVAEARAGNPQEALVTLRSLLSRFPADARLLADTAIVASWQP